VKTGDVVEVGSPLGRVGNSGNTDEPHLHMHVQRELPETSPLGGEPLWFTIGGRFLVRNDVLVIRCARAGGSGQAGREPTGIDAAASLC